MKSANLAPSCRGQGPDDFVRGPRSDYGQTRKLRRRLQKRGGWCSTIGRRGYCSPLTHGFLMKATKKFVTCMSSRAWVALTRLEEAIPTIVGNTLPDRRHVVRIVWAEPT